MLWSNGMLCRRKVASVNWRDMPAPTEKLWRPQTAGAIGNPAPFAP
jgi:hypothetical protein